MVWMVPPPETGMERRRNLPFAEAYRRPPAPPPVWAGGPQPQEQSRFGAVAAFGGAMVGIGALGFVPVGGRRVWDHYLRAIRAVEEISPARIFRTFQYSEMLSPFGSNRAFTFPAELFTYQYERAAGVAGGKPAVAPNRAMRRFVSNMLGRPIAELEEFGAFRKGIEFRRTGWMFGEVAVAGGGPVLSTAALPMRIGTHAGGSFVDWYARLTGIRLDLTESVARMSSTGTMAVTVPKVDRVLGIPLSEVAQVRLQKARVAGRMARAYWAGQIGRLNRLLAAPADWFPALGRVMHRVGIRRLTVQPGSALQMLGRYTAKGLAIAGAYKGFQYLSYLRGQTESRWASGAVGAVLGGALGGILRQTRRGAIFGAGIGAIVGVAPLFDRGVVEGAATAYTRAAMAYARASETTGLTEARREQEEFMPGVTRARTLLGFTTSGMMLGLLGGYALKLAQFRQQGIEGAADFMQKQTDAIKARAQAIRVGQPGLLGRAAAWFGEKTGAGTARGLRGRILMRGGWIGAMMGAAAFGALAIGAAWGTGNVLPGILGAEHTPEELERLYTGREDVAIRRGRWWEFGRSPWEGGRISHYRPHWYHLLMTKAKIKGLHRDEKAKWDASPMLHPLKALFDEEFKYRWERENYYERPYPMTGTYGADVPFLAPITETLGRLVKPPRLMHTEEWLVGSGLEGMAEHGVVKHVATAAEHEPAYDLGGLKKGAPVSRHEAKQQIGEFIYRMNELRGLTGFIHSAVKESLTGSQDYFDKMEQLETATRAYGAERAYWDKELGGLLGMTEAFRRFLPHRRRQIELYNPIRNLMPEWLPGCFVAGTLVWTKEGYVPIEDLITGDEVLSHTGVYNTVKHTKQRYYSGELVTLSVQGVAQDITTTRDHPFLVVRSGKCPYYKTKDRYCIPGTHPNENKPCKYCKEKQYAEPEWVEAGKIREGDFVLCPTIRDRKEGQRDYIRYHGADAARRVKSISRQQVEGLSVYNLEVNNDHTYNVYGVAVHNSEYYIDFLHGDPYTKVKEGEIRLPGRGYAALHPEVEGLLPEEYPLFHRFKILADVALYSDQFKKTKREMRSAIRRGEVSRDQIAQFQTINQQVSERKKRKRFQEYRFAQDALEERRVVVADVLPSGFIRTKRQGVIGLGGVEVTAEKGTGDYRRKQTQVADYLREYVQPGMELDVFTHRDPLHRFKKGPEGYYQPAVIEHEGANLAERLVDADVLRLTEEEDPFALRAKYNKAQRMLGGIWETITHYESPREYMLPLSPKAKFIHARTAIEEYERTRLYGTEAAFWQHPIEHFLEPAVSMAAREWFGTTDIPEDIQRRRNIEDYFDRLKWVKYRALERAADDVGDAQAVKEFKAQQRRTLFGVNPYGSLSYVYSAMPSLDRDYYEAFKDAQSPEDRATIMQMIAPNQRKLYMAKWRNRLAASLRAKLSMGLADESAEQTLRSLNMARYAEGRKITPPLWRQYQREAEQGESYADWSRRREAAEYFTEEAPLPGPNWVGWHPHVDLEDVKLKIVDSLGEDIHDYNLWPSRRQTLVRKPYITDEPLTAEMRHPSELAKAVEGTLRDILKLKGVQVHVLPAPDGQDEVQLEISDSRKHALQKYKNDPTFAEMV